MENKTKSSITNIERVLASGKLTKEQRETLTAFDRFNELEVHCSLRTRAVYLQTLYGLGAKLQRPYQTMIKEDLQSYLADEAKRNSEGTVRM